MSHSLQWNLWRWVRDKWHVVAAYESEADAMEAVGRWMNAGMPMTVSRANTPKDQYMRDNAAVRHAPNNYLRLSGYYVPSAGLSDPPPPDDKPVDSTARGGFDT